jgi:DNA-binding transcriptional ArsR family regulator
MNAGVRNIGEIDRVVHEPGRLMIVALLSAVKQADFVYLQHETALNKGTLSSHLSRLEEAGYVSIEKTFQGKPPRFETRALKGLTAIANCNMLITNCNI